MRICAMKHSAADKELLRHRTGIGPKQSLASRRLSAVPRRSDRARQDLIFGSVRDGSRKQKDHPKAVSDFATVSAKTL
jgi:hypothetical protein